MESKNNFTEEEIEAAAKVKKLIISRELPESLQAIYMAGEISMFMELKSEQGPVVTQSEKGEMIEEIWEKIIYTQHVESGDEAYIIEKDDFIKAMQEYALHSKQQARVEGIQECIEAIKENFQWLQAGGWSKAEICQVLEKLKSRQ